MRLPHLLVDLSGHGFGHLAQTATVLNRLGEFNKEYHLTVRSSLPESVVRARINSPFEYQRHELDTGMIMLDALRVDRKRSFDWYQAHHDRIEQWLAEEKLRLEALSPDLLFCNVPYISLAAADALNLPSMALCSLNWHDILKAYPPEWQNNRMQGQFESIMGFIHQAYASARVFLKPEPSIPMAQFENVLDIGPIAEIRLSQRKKVMKKLPPNVKKIVLVGLGGIPADFSIRNWPEIEGVHWLMPNHLVCHRQDMQNFSSTGLDFVDLLAACDLVITKTGYGTMVEAVCHQKPLLCIERGDWPEEAVLFPWCRKNGYLDVTDFDSLQQGNIINEVNRLLDVKWQKPPIEPDGTDQAVESIIEYLNLA